MFPYLRAVFFAVRIAFVSAYLSGSVVHIDGGGLGFVTSISAWSKSVVLVLIGKCPAVPFVKTALVTHTERFHEFAGRVTHSAFHKFQ